jgi:hypothetical protein
MICEPKGRNAEETDKPGRRVPGFYSPTSLAAAFPPHYFMSLPLATTEKIRNTEQENGPEQTSNSSKHKSHSSFGSVCLDAFSFVVLIAESSEVQNNPVIQSHKFL